ncbi:MAG TPA: hypothetical protein VIH25_14000 [Steroidobacteraceae bacterium]
MNQPQPADTAAIPAARRESFLQKHPRLRRELYVLGAALATGLIVMPTCMYVVGTLTLGPYSSGGWVTLFADLFKGLFRGWWPAWSVVLGPYALIAFLRGTRLVYRKFLRTPEST